MIRTSRLPQLLIILVGLAIYFNSLFNGFIIGDDEDQVLNNPLVHSLESLPTLLSGSTYYAEASGNAYGLFYRPVMMVSYNLLYNLFGPDPLFFHLAQILLHLVNSILVYLLFRHFFRDRLALGLALIFVSHPLNSENVLYIANLQETWFLCFGLLGLLFLLSQKLSLFWVSVCLFMSLISKETGIVFGLIYLIYARLYRSQVWKRLSIWLLLAVGMYVWLRWNATGLDRSLPDVSQLSQVSTQTRLMNVPAVLAFYLVNFLWPHQLAIHQFWVYPRIGLATFWLPLAIIIIFLGLLVLIYIRSKKQPKLRRRYLFFGTWFIAGLALHSQLVPLYLTVATRWFYLPMVGLLGVIGVAGQLLEQSRIKKLLGYILVVVIGCYSLKSYQRTWDWRSSQSLLNADIDQAPQDYYVENLLAIHYLRHKAYSEAEVLLERSVNQYAYTGNLTNLGIVYMHKGDYQQAESYFRAALKKTPTYQSIVNYVNFLHYKLYQYDRVVELSTYYLNFYPQGYDLWLAKAQAAYLVGDKANSLEAINQAMHLKQTQIAQQVYEAINSDQPLEIEHLIE